MQSVRMAAVVAAFAVIGLAGAPAFAAPPAGNATPAASPLPTPVPSAVPPSKVCTIGTNAAVDITGLVATSGGYVVIDGKNNDWAIRVAYLNTKCARIGSAQSYPNGLAVDPQDIAVDSKGVLWIADIGDQPVNPNRSTIALFKVTSKTSMTRYKFSYPDGPHNAEALLLNGDGAPIFVTKAITAPAGIYTYSGTLKAGTTMKLTKAGQFTPEQTGTANKLGTRGAAQNEVTGGANAPGGKKVALRTLTDAYEWDVTNGDVIGALTKGKPRITPLPNEDQGYAIAYTADGSSFLTVSDSPDATPILKYKPSTATAAVSAGKNAPNQPNTPGALRQWFNGLSFSQLMWLLAGVAAFGFVLLMIGVLAIRRSRKAYAAEAARADNSAASAADGPRSAGGGVYGAPGSSASGRGTVYGNAGPDQNSPFDPYSGPRGQAGGQHTQGGVYSGGQASGPYSGGQHSGGQYSGGQYGAPRSDEDDRQSGGRRSPYRGTGDEGYRG